MNRDGFDETLTASVFKMLAGPASEVLPLERLGELLSRVNNQYIERDLHWLANLLALTSRQNAPASSAAGTSDTLPSVFSYTDFVHTFVDGEFWKSRQQLLAEMTEAEAEPPWIYDFQYHDCDALENEIDEFYSYVEMASLAEERDVWDEPWAGLDEQAKKAHLETLLNQLSTSDSSHARIQTNKRLLYLLRGTFQDATSANDMLEKMRQNARLMFQQGALTKICQGLYKVVADYELIQSHLKAEDARESLMEVLHMELQGYVNVLYHIVVMLEPGQGREEMMSLDPPLPVQLLSMLSSIRDRNAKGYPVKKILLLLWKTWLAIFGTWDDAKRTGALTRRMMDLDPRQVELKARPAAVAAFTKDTEVKYPTFVAPIPKKIERFDMGSLAEALNPVPSTPTYSVIGPMPDTPAPTPPPSSIPAIQIENGPLKLKKAQFQTSQSRPFPLPLSEDVVPEAIREARELFETHSFVPTGIAQIDSVKREMTQKRVDAIDEVNRLNMMMQDVNEADKADFQRLIDVEKCYTLLLPILPSANIVILKLLLATITVPGEQPSNLQASPAMEPPEELQTKPLSAEEVDVYRHREITSKAVAALLLNLLRWFKVSHVLKFHWLAQNLVDNNALLLIVKIFGLQDISRYVKVKHDIQLSSFLNFCIRNFSRTPFVESKEVEKSEAVYRTLNGVNVRLETDFSWRNFFTVINFAKILQKMLKAQFHRNLIMVHHPMFQLQILKIIKGQVPFCGRKWKQSNMKAITAIYLNCRPDLRDDWLNGLDVDQEGEDSVDRATFLRDLIFYYNKQNYGVTGASFEVGNESEPVEDEEGHSFGDRHDPLSHHSDSLHAELLELGEDISDSESMTTLGDLNEQNAELDFENPNVTTWQHMSPRTMAKLSRSPSSPLGRRGHGEYLRPVTPFGLDSDPTDEEEEIIPRKLDSTAVDEVEYMYGE